MVKIYYFISACLLLFSCNNCNTQVSSFDDTTDTISGVVNIHIGEESQYEDDPKLYEWGNIYSNRYTYHIKRKDKYFSITNDVIEDDPDVYIEKEKVKDSGLKYYTYEDE